MVIEQMVGKHYDKTYVLQIVGILSSARIH